MKNREVYLTDPAKHTLVNKGVANVNDERDAHALAVLRYELETFVCDGRYQDGLERILSAFLSNLKQPQQPAVWVSGFYGSGKSHLVKMLRALWENTAFPDGKKARDIATLPQSVRDYLAELTQASRLHGGLRAASGTLGAGASGSVRLALLRVIFKSVGLPDKYPQARFVMWLKEKGILETVQAAVERNGGLWEEELEHFYVGEGLHQALVATKPNIFPSAEQCAATLEAAYPNPEDISIDDMVHAIRQALNNNGKMPLTLIVLDEVQQYIGENSTRSIDVQESVEACVKNIGSQLLFIGTGQTAVTGTSNLKKLEGRFTVRVELSDTDVDAVIRKVVLAKKPTSKPTIEKVMESNSGEIARHLASTQIAHQQSDQAYWVADYPILPVRRRFWEKALRVLDRTGTDSQLRNQLSMVHNAIQTNLDHPLGHIIPADYLFFDSADKLLQAHVLPRKVHEKTMTWYKGTPGERLMARATAIVFLVNKMGSSNRDLGIRADVNTIADLLIEDLNAGSSALRDQLTGILDHCELLMKVNDEYRIQTEESTAWNDDYQSQRNRLGNESHLVDNERNQRIKRQFDEMVPNKHRNITQGKSRTPREMLVTYDSRLPVETDGRIYIWVRDGWSVDEESVKADARHAGTQSPTIFVFIPRHAGDDLRSQIINHEAARATLNQRGVPSTAEGTEARAYIQSVQNKAEMRIQQLLAEAFAQAKIFKGGGDEVPVDHLPTALQSAGESSLARLYPQFATGDHEGWSKVYTDAAKGAPDALKHIGFNGEPASQPVCRQIQQIIGASKPGSEISNHFKAIPYGWPQDTIDGALQVLLVAGSVRAYNEQGQMVAPQKLERRQIGKSTFKIETVTLTKPQLIHIRKLFQQVGLEIKPDEEQTRVGELLAMLEQLADSAGGDAPRPARPDTAFLEAIRTRSGNPQLQAIFDARESISSAITAWNHTRTRINEQLPLWDMLLTLLHHADNLPDAVPIREQAMAIETHRMLLDDPDPIRPLGTQLETLLRDALRNRQDAYNAALQAGWDQLEADPAWNAISQAQRDEIARYYAIHTTSELLMGSYEQLVAALEHDPLNIWQNHIDALSTRIGHAREEAARLLVPQAKPLTIPRRTLQNIAELDAWLQEVREQVAAALGNGPVILK